MTSKTNSKKHLIIVPVFLIAICGFANAEFIWGTPANLDPIVQSSSEEAGPSLSSDALSLFFFSSRSGGYGGRDLWVTTRTSISDPWEPPVNLGPTINSAADETEPSISADGLSLYFSDGLWFESSPRPDGFGQSDIWVASRATAAGPWGPPVSLGPNVNTGAKEGGPTTTSDGLVLIFDSDRSGGRRHDLWMATRPTISDLWSPPVNLGPTVNSSAIDAEPSVSPDGLVLFFMSNRTGGGYGDYKIWVTTRPSVSDDFGTPVELGSPVNSSAIDATPDIAPNGLTLCFMTERATSHNAGDLWQVSITPIVDFNGDEVVDLTDFCRLAQCWGQHKPSVDIAPGPFGDHTVDHKDLAALGQYWLKQVPHFGLVAHWKLDEAEGNVAYNSVSDYDAILHGNPIWQPAAGKLNGALEFEGIDDYVSTAFVLNPADGAFSIFAWVKGGAPGQVIISQIGGANWLLADPLEGNLMTSLSAPAGRFAPQPLTSETAITDGNWHRVGFSWDGSNRMLYVDNVEVATDTQSGLAGSEGGLYLGVGKDLDTGSFFFGLIDDVRIYDRAIVP